ncbi:MAG TPA: ABC transporter ATP-binding protein [Arenicellales bacterium]|nr:ABC transporter ATP-binding protein [Arenicellales bacterium]
MSEPILEAVGISKRFAGVYANRDVTLSVDEGELLALIGPNGAGKSTLVNQLAGEMRSDAGSVWLRGENITAMKAHARARLGVSRSFQVSALFDGLTVEHNLILAVQAHEGHSFHFWQAVDRDRRLTDRARELARRFDLSDDLETLAGALAHGEKRQLEVAMALAGDPAVLLLDEPMAGIGPGGSVELTRVLEGLKKRHAILLIEHDMDAVFALADRIAVLDGGELIFCGRPDDVRRDERVRRAYLGDD